MSGSTLISEASLGFGKIKADVFTSWTVLTWIVVFGSTVVMMLWIVIYSFLPSTDFIDEVIILFGNVTFWSVVLFTTVVAIGL